MIQNRNIALSIILTFVTCGIYGIYWMYTLAEDLNKASGANDTSGGMVILLTIITCGIYGWFWIYKAGEKIRIAQSNRNFSYISDQGAIYLLLSVFGLSIISYALIQSELNKIANHDAGSINI